MKNNLCNTCRFSKWDLESVANAYCDQNPTFKVIGEGNYINGCSAYKSKNVIMCVINFIKRNE